VREFQRQMEVFAQGGWRCARRQALEQRHQVQALMDADKYPSQATDKHG